MGHLLKIKCVDSRVNVHILASTSGSFTHTTVQVPNSALTHTKQITVPLRSTSMVAVPYSTVLYGTVKYSKLKYSTVKYSTVQNSTIYLRREKEGDEANTFFPSVGILSPLYCHYALLAYKTLPPSSSSSSFSHSWKTFCLVTHS
jgi:hypothetical protein